MPTIQLPLGPDDYGKLSYLAGRTGKRKVDVAVYLLRKAVSQEFDNEVASQKSTPKPPPVSAGRGVKYNGSDPRLKAGGIYKNYAEVLRIVRPDLAKLWPEGKLYNPKAHGGDNAESILQRYEPGIHKDLSRV